MLSMSTTSAPLARTWRTTVAARAAGSGNGYVGKEPNSTRASWSAAASAIRRWYR